MKIKIIIDTEKNTIKMRNNSKKYIKQTNYKIINSVKDNRIAKFNKELLIILDNMFDYEFYINSKLDDFLNYEDLSYLYDES